MYVLQGMRPKPAGRSPTCSRACCPFLAAYLFAVALLMVFPELALWLPRAWG
jgi:TRAP-type C4-dicarboxylate transport system permease large subunit